MNVTAIPVKVKPTVVLFALLFAIGSVYLASLAWFLAKGRNFIDAEKTAAATRFAQSTALVLPADLTFGKQSRWSQTLTVGWNRPENWGVWSDSATAELVLPAIANAPVTPVCFRVRIGTYYKIRHWSMTIDVNGRALAPTRQFSGQGPVDIEGAVPVATGSLIHLQLAGPEPKIPMLVTRHGRDPRSLGYSLLGITITPRCDRL